MITDCLKGQMGETLTFTANLGYQNVLKKLRYNFKMLNYLVIDNIFILL
jgi:hypothetical protein